MGTFIMLGNDMLTTNKPLTVKILAVAPQIFLFADFLAKRKQATAAGRLIRKAPFTPPSPLRKGITRSAPAAAPTRSAA